jgi:branched-subunit amino acid aminotransferase/4-amino-4-deoxychorismate lyase
MFVWGPSRRLLPGAPSEDPLLAADSWLVDEGRVRGLDLHRRRFFRGCQEAGRVAPEELRAFWAAAVRKLPRRGRSFPRVELGAGTHAELRLRIRPAPPRGGPLRLWTWPGPDPRTAPRRKGPDIARLAEVRRRAAAVGADEALLTTPSGLVLETTTCSVMWWEGEDLCVPDRALRVLSGVTAQLIRDLARRSGTRLRRRRRRLKDLAGCEIWLVNALHGIRTVSAWIGSGVVPAPARRARDWQRRLEGLGKRLG